MKQEHSVHQRPSLAGCATPEPGVAQPADTGDRMTTPVLKHPRLSKRRGTSRR